MRSSRTPVAVLAATAALCALLAAPAAAAEPTTLTFPYTGDVQTLVIPAGVERATFALRGGSGGSAGLIAVGGVAARLTATLPVTPGARYEIRVGGSAVHTEFHSYPLGGWNGGGDGAGFTMESSGGGGGASDVRVAGGGLAERLLVAAGGGGAGGIGGGQVGSPPDGGSADADGAAGYDRPPAFGGGGGRVAGAGGAAGAGTLPGVPGGDGAPGQGGAGGAAGTTRNGNGGGGGGGWIGGGGGGAAGVASGMLIGGGGSGAGGSSHADGSATGVTRRAATQSGDGAVSVTFGEEAPVSLAPPTVSGAAQVGETVTCDPGSWSGAPALDIAWLRDGTPIAGATAAQLTLTRADAQTRIACEVTAVNSGGSATARSAEVEIPPHGPAANLEPPTVGGEAAIGRTLVCDPGRWSVPTAFAYRWLRDGVAFVGATGPSLSLTRADAGRTLQCVVVATVGRTSVTAQTVAVGGPARLLLPASVAVVSRAGRVVVPVACTGPTACAIPEAVATSAGRQVAHGVGRTVSPGTVATLSLALSRDGRRRLRRPRAAVLARVVATPDGGYGGNARMRLVAPRGVR